MTTQTDLFQSLYAATVQPVKIRIEFDGGTPCNIPRLGYGNGYGSYQLQNCQTGELLPIVRMDFGKPMSANVAEMETLRLAVWDVKKRFGEGLQLIIHGDSQIALNWAAGKKPSGKAKKLSPKYAGTDFGKAVKELHRALEGFHVEVHWRGRERSVKVFGH